MATFPGPYAYFGPCDFVLASHRLVVGEPPPGYRWRCVQAGGTGAGAVVYAEPIVAGTYLDQFVHVRGSLQDVAVTTHHWRWEGVDPPADADFAAVEAAMLTFWQAIATYRTTSVTTCEHRWYGPRDAPGPWGDAIRITPTGGGGSGNNGLPAQVACAVTERTDVRRRWGRFYIPALGTNTLETANSNGVFSSTFVTAVANAAEALLDADIGSFAPVVFGTPEPTSLPIRAISVDQVPDVQRRRRIDSSVAATVRSFV